MVLPQPSSGTFPGCPSFKCNCIQLVCWSSQEPKRHFDVLSAKIEIRAVVPAWEICHRKEQQSPAQFTWDQDYPTCTCLHHSPPRTHCAHAAQGPEKQPLAMCGYPKARRGWYMAAAAFCVTLALRGGVNFSPSLIWVGSGAALIYRLYGRSEVVCQFLGPDLRDWQLPLMVLWETRSGGHQQPAKKSDSEPTTPWGSIS